MVTSVPAFKQLFDVDGVWHTDDAGHIHVQGDLNMITQSTQLWYQFAQVTGDFRVSRRGLMSLKGMPAEVGGSVYVSGNPLTNLDDCATHVKGSLYMTDMPKLQQLTGFPLRVGRICHITWDENLPMLRCLAAQFVDVQDRELMTMQDYDRKNSCMEILNSEKWIGKGKTHMLNCALALKQAGLEGNAKW
jgi:hypothetical protein